MVLQLLRLQSFALCMLNNCAKQPSSALQFAHDLILYIHESILNIHPHTTPRARAWRSGRCCDYSTCMACISLHLFFFCFAAFFALTPPAALGPFFEPEEPIVLTSLLAAAVCVHTCVCVCFFCACARARACVCVRARVCVSERKEENRGRRRRWWGCVCVRRAREGGGWAVGGLSAVSVP